MGGGCYPSTGNESLVAASGDGLTPDPYGLRSSAVDSASALNRNVNVPWG
jgi:hypothetical protein